MARYLVTGGAGFIGSNLARALLSQGDGVRVLDNFSTGRRDNLTEIVDRVDVVEGDLCDPKAVERAVEGVDYILHQAALPSVPRSVEAPLESHNSNATGTLTLLEAARRAGVRRLVYASSSSVYGAEKTLPKRESMPTEPLSPYAVSKLAGEHYCAVFYRLYGLETISLRYFNVFGPRQDPHSPYSGVISRFIDAILSGTPPRIFGDGEQTRDFTYVENVTAANLAACQCRHGVGGTYNIGCAARVSVNQLWKTMADLAGVRIHAVHQEPRSGDIRHSQADISRAKEALGFEPRVDLVDGLKRTLEFYGIPTRG